MEIKLISCPLCLKPHFEGVDALRSTLISVATSHLTCPVCDESLMGLDKLTIHLFSHISSNVCESQLYKQPKEIIKGDPENNIINDSTASNGKNEATLQEELNKSIDIIKQQMAKEKICEDNEMKNSTETEDVVLRCDICNFSFSDKTILEMHQKLLHQTIPDKNTGQQNYHCHLCSKKFKKRGSLMVHLRVAHYGYSHQNERMFYKFENAVEKDLDIKEEPNVETKGLAKANNQKTSDNHKQWECDVCSKLFTTKYFLKKHKRLHTGEMPYCCTQCNKCFTFQQSYHKHMLYHSSEKPYVCNECGRAFKELSTLQNHARIHSGERPFVCETCGKRFRQRVSYLVHRRIHTGVMPYKCTVCDKSFRYKVSQRSHKCLVSPPGSFIKISESSDLSTSSELSDKSKCALSVDFDTGNANFMHEAQQCSISCCNDGPENDLLKQSIVLSNNEQIHITYNKSDLTSALRENERPVSRMETEICKNEFRKEKDVSDIRGEDTLIPESQTQDLFSMIMSPLLPDVESLCLSNNSPLQNNVNSNGEGNEILSSINEESLKELIYGVLNKCVQ